MELEQYIQEHVALIVINNKSLAEATSRSAQFLVAQAVISGEIKNLEQAKSGLITLTEVKHTVAIAKSDGKNITEKKGQADSDPEYTSVREALEAIEADITYLKTHMRIFENAHVLFRQHSKE